jgi:hypothetical protein
MELVEVQFLGQDISVLNEKEFKNQNHTINLKINIFSRFSGPQLSRLEFIKLDETIILCPLHLPSRDREKFEIIQDVDTDSKFYKKAVWL